MRKLQELPKIRELRLNKPGFGATLWGMKTKPVLMMMNSQPAELPETVSAGDEIEVQLSPFGNFPGLREGASEPTVQICDREAFETVTGNFSDQVLVDCEHKSETGGDTDASAWVTSVRVDPELGLMGTFKLTDLGADLLRGRRMRFLSPAWTVGADGRPERLLSVALTNKPNLPVRPILNRADGASSVVEDQTKGQPMNELITLLGLPEDADEAAVVAAVKALKEAADAAAEKALNDEAEAAADENEERIENRAAFVAAYKANPDMAKAMLNTLRRKPVAEPVHRVCNRSAARTPAGGNPDMVIFNRWQSLPQGREKDAYLVNNKAAIMRANAALNELKEGC